MPASNSTDDIHETPAYNTSFHLPILREESVVAPLVAHLQRQAKDAVYYHNATGFLKGSWNVMDVQLPVPIPALNGTNLTEVDIASYNASLPDRQRGSFPWLSNGTRAVDINFRESEISPDDKEIQMVRGTAEIKSGTRTLEVELDGVQSVPSSTLRRR